MLPSARGDGFFPCSLSYIQAHRNTGGRRCFFLSGWWQPLQFTSLILPVLQNQRSQSSGAHPTACVRYVLNQFLSSHLMSGVASAFMAVFYRRSPSSHRKSKWPLMANGLCSKSPFFVGGWVSTLSANLAPLSGGVLNIHSQTPQLYMQKNIIKLNLWSHILYKVCPLFCTFDVWFWVVFNRWRKAVPLS